MIKTIIFDLGNVVLTNEWHFISKERDKAFEKFFQMPFEKLEPAWDKAWPKIERGQITEEEFWEMIIEFSKTKNTDVSKIKRLWRKYQSPIPGMFRLLSELKGKYRLVVCSNSSREWARFKIKKFRLDRYFKDYVISGEVGVAKPDPKIYAMALKKSFCEPGEAIFVDDTAKIVDMADKLGLKGILFKNSRQLKGELKKYLSKPVEKYASDRSKMFYWQTDRPFSEKEIKEIFLDRFKNFDAGETKRAVEYGMVQAGFKQNDVKVIKIEPPVKAGSVNSSSHAYLNNGLHVIIRVHPTGVLNSYFYVEKLATEAAAKAGIPTYKTFYVDNTKSKFPFDFMIMESAKGKNMHLSGPFSKAETLRLEFESGRLAAKINSIKTEGFGFFNNEVAKNKNKLVGFHKKWTDHISSALEENLKYLRDSKMISESDSKKVESIFERNQDKIKLAKPSLIHNDLAPWNELVENGHVSAILDWDECFSGDPVCEISTYALFFEGERLNKFIEGYKTILDLPVDYDFRFHYYRLRYTISKMTLRTKRYLFDKSPFIKEKLDYAKKSLRVLLDGIEPSSHP